LPRRIPEQYSCEKVRQSLGNPSRLPRWDNAVPAICDDKVAVAITIEVADLECLPPQ